MLEAFARGKAIVSEDLLTSLVFGLLPHRAGALTAFLARARTLDHQAPLAPAELRFEAPAFWPQTDRFGEPDVIIRGRVGDAPVTVIVEAKFGAGKSQWGAAGSESAVPRDQLARYWSAWKAGSLGARQPREKCVVVYLTAHLSPPLDDLRESAAAAPDAIIAWLSWGDLVPVLGSPSGPAMFDVVASDLLRILRTWGFGPFSGFSFLATHEPVGQAAWWFDVGGIMKLAIPVVDARACWTFDGPGKGAAK